MLYCEALPRRAGKDHWMILWFLTTAKSDEISDCRGMHISFINFYLVRRPLDYQILLKINVASTHIQVFIKITFGIIEICQIEKGKIIYNNLDKFCLYILYIILSYFPEGRKDINILMHIHFIHVYFLKCHLQGVVFLKKKLRCSSEN